MGKKIKSGFIVCLFLLTSVFALPYAVSSASDRIIAVVNNEIITQRDLEDFVNFMRLELSRRGNARQLEENIDEIKSELLNKLIDDRLILQEARKEKITIERSRIRARIDEIKSGYPSEGEFQRFLATQGLTQTDIESKIEEQLLIFRTIELNVREGVSVSPREVTEFYRENPQFFVSPPARQVRALLIGDKETALKVADLIDKGMDLEKASTVYIGVEFDDLGPVERGQFRKEVEDTIFALGIGEISEPVFLQGQYFIFRIDDSIPSRNYSLDEAQEDIHNRLYELKMQERMRQWLKSLRDNSYVQVR